MLEKCTYDVFGEKSIGKTIILLGAGASGKRFIQEYHDEPFEQIILCDNDKNKQKKGMDIAGEKWIIHSVEIVEEYKACDTCIVIASEHYSEIYQQICSLIEKNFPVFVYPFIKNRSEQLEMQVKQCLSDYYYHNHFDLSRRNEFVISECERMKNNNQMVLPYLPIYLTTKCTLNCEKCNNLMPYIKESHMVRDFSEEKIEKSMTNILNCVQEIIFCELVGGEPFLYGNLEEILDFIGKQKKIRQIVIVTNGTIIPSNSILKLLKKYNVLVRISDYGMFDKIARLVVTLEKYDINVRILQDMKWNDPGNIDRRDRSYNELYFQYNKCPFSIRCKYLTEDKLYTCARIASLAILGKYNGEEDVLKIDEKLTEDVLENFYLQDIGRGCMYCDLYTIDSGMEIPAAVQKGRKQIEHSQYTIIRNDYLERLKKK